MLRILSALIAIVLPVWLLYRYRSQSWYWHVLAVVVAVAIGLVPGALNTPLDEYLIAVPFGLLMVWGLGGLVTFRSRGHKLA